MRKVMVQHYVKTEPVEGVAQTWVFADKGEALFHAFGVDYEEFETGAGNFSTAIVEWPDGTIENVPVTRIRFLDKIALTGDK